MTLEDIQRANLSIKTTNIRGKDYAEVAQRIKAFRSICPNGSIITEMIYNDDKKCIIKATIMDGDTILGTGTAYEVEASNKINSTSYIENCETSAVGRALGMCGFGIDMSVASADEVRTAIRLQTYGTDPRATLYRLLAERKVDATEYGKKHNLTKDSTDEDFIKAIDDLIGEQI